MTNVNGPDTHVLKIVDVDGEAVVVLPDAVCARLGVTGTDDLLELVEETDGFTIRSATPPPVDQIGVAREVMERRRYALGELAKGESEDDDGSPT
jgi:hypothetical protein